jgi:hypothetical protein
MKKRILWELLFIFILGFAGWYLYGLMERAKSNNPDLIRIERNNSLMFMSGAGIDIMGNEIESIILNNQDESEVFVAAFLLRYNSLEVDLAFWNEISSHLSEPNAVRLTAYCENVQCIETVRKNPDMARFTILEYGAVTDMQAVINADANGELWLRGDRTMKKIRWRDEMLTPYNIVNSMKLSGAQE